LLFIQHKTVKTTTAPSITNTPQPTTITTTGRTVAVSLLSFSSKKVVVQWVRAIIWQIELSCFAWKWISICRSTIW